MPGSVSADTCLSLATFADSVFSRRQALGGLRSGIPLGFQQDVRRCHWYNDEVAKTDRSAWFARKYASFAEADAHDLEFWLRIPEDERALQVWRLSEELYRLTGQFPDEPTLSRSVERVRRG